ncbi:ABC transporter permease [Luteococcus peritonei]|uniref:ABC transporter permease n=1 Tax=Luteococcus peritonei TaxID=88874 RepID=A0ABW4RV63_9ACTN
MSPRRRAALACLLLVLLLLALVTPVAATALGSRGRAAAVTTLSAQAPLLGNTMLLGVLQASLTLLLASRMALLATRRAPGRRLVHLACLAPLLMPPYTMALALVVTAGHNGLLRRHGGELLPSVYGLGGMVVAGSLSLLPHAYLALLAAERAVDPGLVEAARSLGLSPGQARRRVVWPRLAAVAAATWLMVFAEAITDLANPLVLGGGYEVLASRVQLAVVAESDLPAAASAALLLSVPTIVVFLLGGMVGARPIAVRGLVSLSRAPAPAQRARPDEVVLGWLVAGGVLALLGSVMVGAVVREIGVDDRPTAVHLADVVAGPHTVALGNSLLLALLVLPLCGGLALLLAWALRCGPEPLPAPARLARRLLGVLAALPGVAVGLALFMVLLRLAPNPSTAWLDPFGWGAALAVAVVHLVRTLPGTVQPVLDALDRRGQELDEAARVLGGSRRQRSRVALPVVGGALLPALVANFSRTLTAVSSVILLSNSHVPLLSVRALVESGSGRVGSACAMAVCLAAVTGAVTLVCAPGRGRP